MQAFGGTFNPGLAPYPKHSFGNPAAIGFSFNGNEYFNFWIILCPCNGYSYSNAGIGLCMFMGGLVEILAGIWGSLLVLK